MKIYKLKQFSKYQVQGIDECKDLLKEDLETISNLTCFFIIEDIKNKELIDGMFFDFGKVIESIKKENIRNKIIYNEIKLQEREILNKAIKEFDKFVQNKINYYLQNNEYKMHIFKISNSEKDRKKLKRLTEILYGLPKNEYTDILEKIFDALYIKHPVKTLSIITFFIFLYTVIILIFKNFSFNEINSNDLLLSIYVILAFIGTIYIFLGIILFIAGFFTTKLYRGIKVIIGLISLIVIVGSIILTIKYLYNLFNTKNLSEAFLSNSIVNLYIKSKGYPKFVLLHTKKGDKLEFIRYIKNGFIYYQDICDVNYTLIKKLKSKSNKRFLDIVDFYNEIYNKVLYAINSKEVKELRKIRTGIPFEIFDKYYKNQCKSKK